MFYVAVSCGRCLKRRASTDYPHTNNADNQSSDHSTSYTSPYYTSSKRSRSNAVDSVEIESSDELAKSCAMDTTQINSLVSIFSQSFSEFSTEDHENSSVYETSTEMNTFALCRDSIALTA